MGETLPISRDSIRRAAEEMIADHGSDALAKATKRSEDLRSEGFESVANTWDLICTVIGDLEDSKRTPDAYKRALSQFVLLSE